MRRIPTIFLLYAVVTTGLIAQPLTVTSNGRFLMARDGTVSDLGLIQAGEITRFDPPGKEERGNDWVLIVDF